MKKKLIQHNLDGVFVLLLFGLFAGSLLMVLFTGAGSYKRVSARDAESYANSTCLQYIAAKLRHSDQVGAVQVGSFSDPDDPGADGISTLYIQSSVNGTAYVTRVYWYEGAVRELYSERNADLHPQDGNVVLEEEGLSFAVSGDHLEILATRGDGETRSLLLFLRSSEEVRG